MLTVLSHTRVLFCERLVNIIFSLGNLSVSTIQAVNQFDMASQISIFDLIELFVQLLELA